MIIKFICEYHGKGFCGFQRQPTEKNTKPSVQQCLEDALSRLLKEQIKISASGRTDAGVHAKGQVCSFSAPKDLEKTISSLEKLHHDQAFFKLAASTNAFLPKTISVRDFEKTHDTFNARFNVKTKTYTYKCYYAKHRSPINDDFMAQLHTMPDIELIKQASNHLLGTHDFTALSSSRTDKENKVRTIYELNIVQSGNKILFAISGNGFLRNMVRIIIGTLLDVGYGKIPPEEIHEIIKSKDRNKAGKTAPPHGLCLEYVSY